MQEASSEDTTTSCPTPSGSRKVPSPKTSKGVNPAIKSISSTISSTSRTPRKNTVVQMRPESDASKSLVRYRSDAPQLTVGDALSLVQNMKKPSTSASHGPIKQNTSTTRDQSASSSQGSSTTVQPLSDVTDTEPLTGL